MECIILFWVCCFLIFIIMVSSSELATYGSCVSYFKKVLLNPGIQRTQKLESELDPGKLGAREIFPWAQGLQHSEMPLSILCLGNRSSPRHRISGGITGCHGSREAGKSCSEAEALHTHINVSLDASFWIFGKVSRASLKVCQSS